MTLEGDRDHLRPIDVKKTLRFQLETDMCGQAKTIQM